ncbi:MAG: transcription antitermination factor NusB [Gammaproteobacteria bacterium]|nr:transcription antitermination factor NusB [Gammaproteobacteria bacterium]MCZ6911247.1 transcription antitermination factor NusB [Pseudomonadota bacterium]
MSSQTEVRARHRRSRARRLAVQALYSWQLAGGPVEDIYGYYSEDRNFKGADAAYFKELLLEITSDCESLNILLAKYADRDLEQLTPVEHSILWLGLFELRDHLEVPFAVVINEAVELSKKFGAENGHRYVNAVLDRAAKDLRAAITGAWGPDAPEKDKE